MGFEPMNAGKHTESQSVTLGHSVNPALFLYPKREFKGT